MDSFEFNKIAGGILGSLLFLVALNIAAEAIYSPPKPAKPGYVIEIPKAADRDGESCAGRIVRQAPGQRDGRTRRERGQGLHHLPHLR